MSHMGSFTNPSNGSVTMFSYTATGAESLSGFPITLPSAQADANYGASVSCGPVADIIAFAVSARTTTTITVVPSGRPTAGDVYFVSIERLS